MPAGSTLQMLFRGGWEMWSQDRITSAFRAREPESLDSVLRIFASTLSLLSNPLSSPDMSPEALRENRWLPCSTSVFRLPQSSGAPHSGEGFEW